MLAAAILAVKHIPNAPFRGCQYKTTVTTTTDETTSTWTGVDIGTPHPDRIVVLAIFQGVNGDVTNATTTVNGVQPCHKTRINEFAITVHKVPLGTTATVAVSATTSLRKAVGIFIAYPEIPIPMESGSVSAATTSDAQLLNWRQRDGGFLIYSGGQLATLGTFTTTWNGTDTLVEDVDAQLEAASSYTFGHINTIISTNVNDLIMAESVSGTKRLVACIWGPPRPGV